MRHEVEETLKFWAADEQTQTGSTCPAGRPQVATREPPTPARRTTSHGAPTWVPLPLSSPGVSGIHQQIAAGSTPRQKSKRPRSSALFAKGRCKTMNPPAQILAHGVLYGLMNFWAITSCTPRNRTGSPSLQGRCQDARGWEAEDLIANELAHTCVITLRAHALTLLWVCVGVGVVAKCPCVCTLICFAERCVSSTCRGQGLVARRKRPSGLR